MGLKPETVKWKLDKFKVFTEKTFMDPWNKNNSPWNRNQQPPNVDELLNNLQQKFGGIFKKNGAVWIIILIAFFLWAATGFFVVNPQEQAVVKRFGVVHRTEGAGPHYHIPSPIETVQKETVTSVRRLEIGYRTIESGPPARYRQVKKESLMLTGDENIVDVQFTVQYKIVNLENYLYHITDPEATVRAAAESAMREVVGHTTVDDALTVGKGHLELTTKELLQNILNTYEAGIHIENVKLQDVHPPDPVKNAFKDVASAKEEKEKLINEAHGYRNNLIPKARGEAAQIINVATAYAEQRVLIAKGEADKFNSIYEEYHKAKEVTRQRIRIETMEEILPKVNKIIVDPQLGKNFLPFLPLQDLDSIKNKR